jgi:uncharacterized membrane protein YphA (DoxX/SURF4 family)
MNNPLQSDSSRSLGLLLARLPLGVVLALAGYMKFHTTGLNQFVNDHLSQVPDYMPSWFGNVYLHAVPFAELGLGVLLIFGLLTRFSGLLATLMLVSFGMIQSGAMGFVNLFPQDASKLFQAPTVYATFAMIAFLAGPGWFSLDQLLWGGRKASK